ncbi:MAG: Gfo/Idh/MocA family oxidoreductase [Verrucomicrobiae bacterium]|nr:Gfo/Idh/MocA family oxidoreductase [Verrucomicrobiae bacterium]
MKTSINVAIIGYGFRASGIAQHLLKNESFRIAAVCDRRRERLDEAGNKIQGGIKLETDYKKVLADRDIDAVFVTVPQFLHEEITVAAFKAGKHVYCEKPLALSVKSCDRMIAAGKKAGKVFMVGQQMRYHSHLQKMSSLVSGGEIGKPVMVWLREFRNPFPKTMVWAFRKEQSGGMLVEKSCHHFDVFTWFANSEPVSVFASGAADVFKKPFGMDSNISDNAYVIVDYANGVRAMLQLCMFMGLPYKYECGVGHHMREIGVAGEKGMIRTEGFDLGANLEIRHNDSRNVTRLDISTSGCLPTKFNQSGNTGIYMDFADCILKGETPFANPGIGRTAVAIALAAEKSCEENRVVAIKETGL